MIHLLQCLASARCRKTCFYPSRSSPLSHPAHRFDRYFMKVLMSSPVWASHWCQQRLNSQIEGFNEGHLGVCQLRCDVDRQNENSQHAAGCEFMFAGRSEEKVVFPGACRGEAAGWSGSFGDEILQKLLSTCGCGLHASKPRTWERLFTKDLRFCSIPPIHTSQTHSYTAHTVTGTSF